MKFQYILILLLSYYGFAICTLLECFASCESWLWNRVAKNKCLRDCYHTATLGGEKKKTYHECMEICYSQPEGQAKEDCFVGCAYVFNIRTAKKGRPVGGGGNRKRKTEAPSTMMTWL